MFACRGHLILAIALVGFNTAYGEEKSRVKRAPSAWKSSPELSASHIKAIVDKHNEWRSKVQPTAANMRRMSWDEGLATKARDYSKKCEFVHASEPGIGESIAITDSKDIDAVVNAFVNDWNKEGQNYDYESSTCAQGKICGHYTQLVWADSHLVGCGISECSSVGILPVEGHVIVCNYRVAGNAVIRQDGFTISIPPYKQGEPCSQCEEGFSCSENLCTEIKEVGDVKKIIVDESDVCYQQNKKMIDAWTERMRIYEEVHLKRWEKSMSEYEAYLKENV